jgi:hypothetical protein
MNDEGTCQQLLMRAVVLELPCSMIWTAIMKQGSVHSASYVLDFMSSVLPRIRFRAVTEQVKYHIFLHNSTDCILMSTLHCVSQHVCVCVCVCVCTRGGSVRFACMSMHMSWRWHGYML